MALTSQLVVPLLADVDASVNGSAETAERPQPREESEVKCPKANDAALLVLGEIEKLILGDMGSSWLHSEHRDRDDEDPVPPMLLATESATTTTATAFPFTAQADSCVVVGKPVTNQLLPLHHQAPPPEAMTELEASFATASIFLNLGMFSLPTVFAQSGLCAVLLVALAMCMCMYTGNLLGLVLGRLRDDGILRPSYGDAAKMALGPRFARIMSASCLLECLAYGWNNQLLLQTCVPNLVPFLGGAEVIVGSCVLCVVLSAISDKFYSYVGLISVISTGLVCSTVIVSGLMLPEWAKAADLSGPPAELPSSFSLIIFCAAGHPLLPGVRNNVDTRQTYERAVRNGYAIWAASAILFGMGGFYLFGGSIKMFATQNIGFDLHSRAFPPTQRLITFSSTWVSFRSLVAQVPMTRPLAEFLGEALGVPARRGIWAGVQRMLLAVPVFAIVGGGAYMLRDQVKTLNTLAGGALMSLNAFVFPAFAYLKVCQPNEAARASAAVTLLFGVALAAIVNYKLLME